MLYIVATAIGNSEDTSLRAIKTLIDSDIILCEDTRSFDGYYKGLQDVFNLRPVKKQYLLPFYREKEFEFIPRVLRDLERGLTVSLVSESGLPVISDPGGLLLKHVIKEDLKYTVIPGPSAFTTAAVLSGFPIEQLLFLGFLPKKKSQIVKLIGNLGGQTAVFYESPHRINETLNILNDIRPNAQIAVCREMTKKFEEVIRGTPEELVNKTYKGELTVVISNV